MRGGKKAKNDLKKVKKLTFCEDEKELRGDWHFHLKLYN